MLTTNDFQPDWVCPPGATIAQLIHENSWTKEGVSKFIGIDLAAFERLISGKMQIDSSLAVKLSNGIGGTKQFWISRELDYRLNLERLSKDISTEELNWLKKLPLNEMKKSGWIPDSELSLLDVKNCLSFFGLKNSNAFNTAKILGETKYRASPLFFKNEYSIAAWVRQGEIKSESIKCRPWDKNNFRAALLDIKKLTLISDPKIFLPKLVEICSNFGVAVVIEKTPKECPVSGVAKFLSKDKALILLSFKYLSDDIFWFTFFHEVGHLILHDGQESFIELDDNSMITGKEEKEANDFSSNILLPKEYEYLVDNFIVSNINFNQGVRYIHKMSSILDVSCSVVVGQLQHRGVIPHTHFNKFKNRYKWEDINF